MQTIFPIRRYQEAREAIRWLSAAFGFVEDFSFPPTGTMVRHAQLRHGTNLIMLGSLRVKEELTSPQVAGIATQALCVYVADPDAHYAQALAAGAQADGPLQDTDFGA